jgi:hypothetical protein
MDPFFTLVVQLRAAQKRYVQTRSQADLEAAKRQGLIVDLAIHERIRQAERDAGPRAAPTLFDRRPGEQVEVRRGDEVAAEGEKAFGKSAQAWADWNGSALDFGD